MGKREDPLPVQLIRYRNLKAIFESRFGANTTQLAKASYSPEKMISRDQARGLIAPNGPGGRWIGESIARRIEKQLQLPDGSLDEADPHNTALVEIKHLASKMSPEHQQATLVLMRELVRQDKS